MKLKGKVAVVTGASRGLGKEMALGLAGEGAAIVVAARTETDTEGLKGTIHTTAEEIRALGGHCLAVKCDVTREDQIAAMVFTAVREFGKFNIAVNCLKPRGAVESEGMRFLHPDADRSLWDTPDKMVKVAVFLAGQDAGGVSGMVATDEEWCAWHGLEIKSKKMVG